MALLAACAFLPLPSAAQRNMPPHQPDSKSQEMLDLPIVPGGTVAITPPPPKSPLPAGDMHNPTAKPLPSEIPQIAPAAADKNAVSVVVALPVAAPAPHTKATLMFNTEEMAIVDQIIKAYDSYIPGKVEKNLLPKENLPSILTGLQPPPVQVQGPSNVYLQGIVYYSPSKWLVRLNDGVISSSTNIPANEFFVSKISRREIELVWKPAQPDELINNWNSATDGGKNPVPGVRVANSVVTLRLHPNQTFLVKSIAIHEGIIKSSNPAGSAQAPVTTPAATPAAEPAATPAIPQSPPVRDVIPESPSNIIRPPG